MNPKVNDYIATIEAINDGELSIQDMHDCLTNSNGYLDDDTLRRLEYAVERLNAVIAFANQTRDSY